MTEKEALQLALEALEANLANWNAKRKAIPIIKEVLEQPAPYRAVKTYHDGKPVYVQEPPKREWQGLTDEDIEEVERWVEFKEEGSGRIPVGKLVRYIEAKLKEKNT